MSIRDVIDELVATSQRQPLPSLTPREVELPLLPGKVDVVTGMRRVGKTYFLFQSMAERLRDGIEPERLLYLNFEDERLMPMEAADLHHVPEALQRRHPALHDREVWLFLDELQVVPGWERFVRRLIDGGGYRLVVTGSSARLLASEIPTSLRGRSLTTELLPFSFGEFLRHSGEEVPTKWPPPARDRSRLEAALSRYLEVGGFPEVHGLPEPARVRVLQEYVDVTLLRDVVERHDVRNVSALRSLVRRLVRNPASALSVHRLYNDMRSQGFSVSKDTLYALIGHLEDAHLVHLVSLDTGSERRRMANPRKAYLADHSLAVAHSLRAGRDVAHLLENVVHAELRRRGFAVSYALTEDGCEVDFVAREARGDAELIQVCADMTSERARQREARALAAAMRETGGQRATIVTVAEAGELALPLGRVPVVPAWRWLLEPR